MVMGGLNTMIDKVTLIQDNKDEFFLDLDQLKKWGQKLNFSKQKKF